MTNFSKGIRKISSGKVGVNKVPVVDFDINGGFKGGFSIEEEEGVIRWNHSTSKYDFFDGTDWKELGSASNPGVVSYIDYLPSFDDGTEEIPSDSADNILPLPISSDFLESISDTNLAVSSVSQASSVHQIYEVF